MNLVHTLRALAYLLLVAGYTAPLLANDAEDRTQRIEDRLLAPCCYSESVKVHRSELAAQIRVDIRRAVEAGRSDREILDSYIARYGLRILREPEGARSTWLHGGVLFGVFLGTLVAVLVIRRLRKQARRAAPSYAGVVADLPDEDLW